MTGFGWASSHQKEYAKLERPRSCVACQSSSLLLLDIKTLIRGEQHSCLAKEIQASVEGGVTVVPEQFLSTLLVMVACMCNK